jgi:hypothetical protein
MSLYTVTARGTGTTKVVPIPRAWRSLEDAVCDVLATDAESLAALVLLPDEHEIRATCPGLLTARAAEAGLVTITGAEEALLCEGRRRRRPPVDGS